MSQRLPYAPLSARKRKAPGMVKEIHGVLISNKRVHLWGPRFADVGVHHNLRTMFADMAPIRIDSSHEEEVVADQVTVPTVSTLAQETVDILGPLEGELEARMSRDGQLATSIIHMGKALEVIRGMLAPARTELLRTSGLTTALRFDASDVARMYERVIQLFATLRGD